jgi:hypothetical protein
MSSANLSKLFAIPSQPLSPSFPLRLPGITEDSGRALVETLKEDYVKYHVFFDTVGRHKWDFVVDIAVELSADDSIVIPLTTW